MLLQGLQTCCQLVLKLARVDRSMQTADSSLQDSSCHTRQKPTADVRQDINKLQHYNRLQQLLQLQAERRAAAPKQHAGQHDHEVNFVTGAAASIVSPLVSTLCCMPSICCPLQGQAQQNSS
jgi:hypothetical protein